MERLCSRIRGVGVGDMDPWPSGEEGSEIMSGQTDASPTSLLRIHLFFDLPLHCS